MRYLGIVFAVISYTLFLSGCEDSNFGVANFMLPVFPEGTEVDPNLFTETWHSIEDDATITIEKVGKSGMRVYLTSASDTLRFTGTAFNIDDDVFLDLVPEIPDDVAERLNYLLFYLFPTHTVAKVRLSDTTMDFSLMDPFKLHDFLAQPASVLSHVKPDAGSIAITASRLENYNFLKTHAHQIEGLFDEVITLVRREL